MIALQLHRHQRAGTLAVHRRRGAATVEFAVIAPILVVVFIGLVEMTRAVQVRDSLTDAVRSGCRLAIQPGANNAAVQANINQVLTNAGLPSGYATITILVNGKSVDVATASKGDQVSVQVGISADAVGWLVTTLFFSSATIESETLVMMRQG